MARMTPTKYAEWRGASHDVLRYHINRGAISRAADGTIDSDEADVVWWEKHQARQRAQLDGAIVDNRLSRARIASTVAKTQLARHKLTEETEALVPKAETIAAADRELAMTLDHIRALELGPLLALGMPTREAHQLSQDFMRTALVGLDDVMKDEADV